jgi:hypothetical protein
MIRSRPGIADHAGRLAGFCTQVNTLFSVEGLAASGAVNLRRPGRAVLFLDEHENYPSASSAEGV